MTDQPELWRTDPRERLLAAIDRTWARGELGATPEQLVDEYAHRLADRQRENTRKRYGLIIATRNAAYARGWALGRDEAADHIDPKHTTEPVQCPAPEDQP